MKPTIFATVLAFAFLPACAELTIEVDVYKGPLTNNERVQIEQVAVMAVGAQPLLIELRDQLEAAGHRFKCDGGMRRLRAQKWYDDRYLDPRRVDRSHPIGSPEYPFFAEPDARRVNSILGLYRDVEDPDPVRSALLSEARIQLARFESAFATFSARPASDRSFMDRMEAAYRADGDLPHHPTGDAREALAGKRDVLKTLYRSFHAPEIPAGLSDNESVLRYDGNGQSNIVAAHLDLQANTACRSWCQDASWPTLTLRGVALNQASNSGLGANARYELLAAPEMAIAHADLLFREDEFAARREFVNRTRTLAAAFLELRGSMDALYELAGRYLQSVPVGESGIPDELHVLAARVMSVFTSPFYARVAMLDARIKREAGTACDGLDDLIARNAEAYGGKSSRAEQAEANRRFAQELLMAILLEPADWGRGLLILQREFRGNYSPRLDDLVGADKNRARSFSGETGDGFEGSRTLAAVRRRFGIIIGPEEDRADWAEAAPSLLSHVRESVGGSQGLDDGRLPAGLNTQIRQFLDAAGTTEDVLELAETRELLDSLVRFAEKLRFLAGFRDVLSSGQNVKNLTEVLSAVSNSILSQIDVLRDIENRPEMEGIEARRAKQDELVKLLEEQLVNETRSHGAASNEVTKIRAALHAAYEIRGGLVHVLPAADFLRNAYVTAEQQNAAYDGERGDIELQYWQNINRIRLTSPGATSYALVKDDVGNWYVKGFRSNTEALVDSAKDLAMFAAAGSVDPTAMARAKLLSQVDRLADLEKIQNAEAGLAQDKANGGLMATQIAAVRERDERGRAAEVDRLTALVTDLSGVIQAPAADATGSDRWVIGKREEGGAEVAITLHRENLPAGLRGVPSIPASSTVPEAVRLALDWSKKLRDALEAEAVATEVAGDDWSEVDATDLDKVRSAFEGWREEIATRTAKGVTDALRKREEQLRDLTVRLETIGAAPASNEDD